MTIGFYVHYHGLGHKHRTEAILQRLRSDAAVVTSRIGSLPWNGPTLKDVVEIACDIDDVSVAAMTHATDVPSLHYAPLWTDTITSRVAQYTGWLDRTKPDLMVIDVSAEISMLTRLASIPQVVVRQHGKRDDDAHLNTYAAAHSLLAPFPASMEDHITPDWVRSKTVYLDGFCRDGGSPPNSPAVQFERPTIVVMFGRGGQGDVLEHLTSAAKSVPAYDWVVVGKEVPRDFATPSNLRFLGWIADPTCYLKAAKLVVSAAGHNSVMEIGSLGRPFIAIAEPRPFEEQIRKVQILDREGLAVGVQDWPASGEWSDLIRRTLLLDTTRWKQIFRQDGAEQAARHLEDVARWSRQCRLSGADHATSVPGHQSPSKLFIAT